MPQVVMIGVTACKNGEQRTHEGFIMPSPKGSVVLMGSGELTRSMVEVYKDRMIRPGPGARAVFLDTPAGFQLNVDDISKKAVRYFNSSVGHPLHIASFKSSGDIAGADAEKAFHALREADFILMGPGSPTYAVRHLAASPIPGILTRRVESGACLALASAAALTAGRYTLPVYELYKVGLDPFWADGLDILGHFGLSLAVVPHWNNAEGGTHDTRFCFMGHPRFATLSGLLPPDTIIVGLDEHTALILDFETDTARVQGVGRVVLQQSHSERVFRKGDHFGLNLLRQPSAGPSWPSPTPPAGMELPPLSGTDFWRQVHDIGQSFHSGLSDAETSRSVTALLEMDRRIWAGMEAMENQEFITQARDLFREWIVLLGAEIGASKPDVLSSLVSGMVDLREAFRKEKKWEEADRIRGLLTHAGFHVEDTPSGPQWRSADTTGQN